MFFQISRRASWRRSWRIEEAEVAPRAEKDIINVLDEPIFFTHIWSNYPPFQTSEIPKKNRQPLISAWHLMGCSGHQKSESFKTSLKLAALLRFTSLEPTCWMQSKKQAKRFTMRVTKLWNRHILESTHLKRAMAISSVIERCKHQTQLKKQQKRMEHLNSVHLR